MENNPEITQRTCLNCQSSLPENAIYCPQCSQKYTTGRVPLKELFVDFVNTQFNLDSKFFKATMALFQPGKLTIEYFKGKHISYASPLRIFLVTALLLFAIVSFDTSNLEVNMTGVDYVPMAEKSLAIEKLDSINQAVAAQFNNSEVSAALDSVFLGFKQAEGPDIDSIPLSLFGNAEDGKEILVDPKDIAALDADELADKYNITSFFDRVTFKQTIKAIKNGKGLLEYFLGKLTLMILLMMPFLALILKLLYIRREFYYVEHLVFSFHYHAFVFLATAIIVLAGKFSGEWVAVFIIGIPVYLFIAMRRVYAQSFGKTLLKFFILNFLYLILALIFFVLTIIVSFVLF